jgi:hypothetical protein
VKAVYHSALERERNERAAFLAKACEHDWERLREVESLLAQSGGDSFLERPAWRQSESAVEEEEEPRESQADAPARGHPFLWVVRLTLAAVIALFGYAAWRMPQDVAVVGWTEDLRGGAYQVTGVDRAGPAAGKLQPGDRLISLNGDPNIARAGTQGLSENK